MKVVIHFSQRLIVRSTGLLPMLYTPRELAKELGVPARTLREWVKRGMPHQRDEKGFIWIEGVEFAAWVTRIRKEKEKIVLGPDEAFCVRCQKPVKMLRPEESRQGKLLMRRGKCGICGGIVNRGGRSD
jgi:hypothetical protein